MTTNTNINVSLTAELKRYLEGEVDGGEYASVSEVVREALRLHRRQKSQMDRKKAFLAEVQGMVASSIKSLQDGHYQDFDSGEALMDYVLKEDPQGER